MPVLESLFDKVAEIEICNFIKKILQHRCFPVKFAKVFSQNTSGGCFGLLLVDRSDLFFV